MKSLDAEIPVVFDYGLAESLAFLHAAGLPWDEKIAAAAAHVRFEKIFLLDLVPLDGCDDLAIRAETIEQRKLLRRLIRDVYSALGPPPLDIPLAPPGKRLALITARGQDG